MSRFSFVMFIIGIVTLIALVYGIISIFEPYDIGDDYCGVCDTNYCEIELLNHRDPGYSPGIHYALSILWDQCNYGKNLDLEWIEEIRLKYNITDCKSFTRINLSNPCPHSPSYKWMETGYISSIETRRDVGYSYLVYINPVIKNTTYYWKMCEIPADLPIEENLPKWVNITHKYYVFKYKNRAWHWQYKDAHIVDATLQPDYDDNINASWNEWRISYNQYLNNGGVDIGDDYWM